MKRCNPPRRVVLRPSFFQPIYRGVNIEHLSSESARMLPVFFLLVSCCVPCTFHVRRMRHTQMQRQRRLMHLWTKRPRRAMSHHLNDSWRVQPSWKSGKIWDRSLFLSMEKKVFLFQVRCLHNFHPDYGPSNIFMYLISPKVRDQDRKRKLFLGASFPRQPFSSWAWSRNLAIAQVHPHEAGCPSLKMRE